MKFINLMLASLFLFVGTANANTVVASWYGPGFHGKKTASGERFNQNAMTAAHKTLPFGTIVAVTYKGRTVHVRINDRGPFIKGRTLDLSKGASKAIGCLATCKVSMAIVGKGKGKKSAPKRHVSTTRHVAPKKSTWGLKPYNPGKSLKG